MRRIAAILRRILTARNPLRRLERRRRALPVRIARGLPATARHGPRALSPDLSAAEQRLTAATKAIGAARGACLIGYARLRGRLMDMFPRQVKVVSGYFPKTRKKPVSKAVAPSEAVG